MISQWTVLHLCLIGALSAAPEHIGKLPLVSSSRPSLNIINGNKTSVTKYNCVASLKQSNEVVGVAIVLNKHWLLTSAFTVAWCSQSVLEFRTGSDFHDKGGQVLKAQKLVIHPNYTGSWDWDIAVVKTDKPIKLGKKVKPAKLATEDLKGGTKCLVAGWGEYDSTGNPSEVLREAQVTTLDWKKCKKSYEDDLTSNLMCTFDENFGPCWADFGAPLMMFDKTTCVVTGLFAGGYGCTPGVNPVLYTDVPALQKWVQQVIKNDEDSELE